MVYIRGLGYIGSPQELLQNEWVIFAGIFLLTFAVVYYSIGRRFSSKSDISMQDWINGRTNKSIKVHPSAVIISGVIAFFTAAAVNQDYLIYEMFGNILGGWILVFTFIVMFLLAIPFLKALKSGLGGGKLAGVISGGFVGISFWLVVKHVFPYDFYYNMTYDIQRIYDFFISINGAIVLVVAGIVIGLIVSIKKK